MKHKKKGAIFVFILVILGVCLYYFLYHQGRSHRRELLLSGTVEATEVEISPELAAKVVALYCREGDWVKKGDLLIKLEDSNLEANLREAKAAKRAIEAEISLNKIKMENARREFERNLRLYQAKAISASRFDAAKTAYDVAKEAYTASLHRRSEIQARIENIRLQLNKTHLSSPISGVVLEKNVEVGEVVFPAMVLMTIGDLRRPWVRVYIGERDIGKVRLGQKALVATDAYPERRFPGTLRYIAHEAEFTPKNIQTRQERVKLVFEARVYLNNEEGILKPGMPVDVYLPLKE